MWYEWIREGQLRKYLRVNQTEVKEVEDLDRDCIRADRPWGPPASRTMRTEYDPRGGGLKGLGMALTTHPHLVLRLTLILLMWRVG
jgi:hypothetical protein